MEFKSYPNYKDSGVEWLGKVPEHWRISSLKRYGYFKGGAGFPHAYQGNTEENIPFFKVNSLSKDKRFLSSFSDFVGEETAKKLGAKIFPKNSIFFAKVGAALLLERIRTNQQPCCIDNNMMGFVIQNELSFDFAFYLMSLIDFKYLVNPGAVPSINESQISSFLISVPPISEQTQIANYLDTETTRIDNLIAKQEKLIELLEEQRKSIISHAVTKGLNPNAPMKDSGVEWLGDVPEHWSENKIKFVSKLITDKTANKSNVIALENIESWTAKLVSSNSDFDSDGICFKKNDVLFGKLRPYLAKVYLAESKGEAIGDIYVLRPNNLINPKFLKFFMLSEKFIDYVNSSTNGTKMPRANWDFIGSISIFLPHIKIQHEIVEYLDSAVLKIELIINKQKSLIEKLKEYRASIISHAVTGKIDVREFGA